MVIKGYAVRAGNAKMAVCQMGTCRIGQPEILKRCSRAAFPLKLSEGKTEAR
jgi:hypothetical protein